MFSDSCFHCVSCPLEKEMAAHSWILAWEIPGQRTWRATVWGHKESDTTGWLKNKTTVRLQLHQDSGLLKRVSNVSSSPCKVSLVCESPCSVSRSCQCFGPWPARLPCPQEFSGKKSRVGCAFLLQGVFPTQGPSPRLLRCGGLSTCWATGEAPVYKVPFSQATLLWTSFWITSNFSFA